MSYRVTHYINGQYVLDSRRMQDLYNPASGSVIGQVALADHTMVDKAVSAAKSAFDTWSETPLPRRARILFQFKNLLDQHIDSLAKMITQEHGKTLADARGSVQRGIDVVEFVCGIPHLMKGGFAENIATEMDSYTIRQPLGVCVGITPFNFPAMIPLWMFPMAIACGNTFVLKPSERDPSCSLKLAELAKEAGFPDGVLNVVQGDKEAVDALLRHPDVKAVSFVGSTATAEHIYQTGTAQGKRVQAFGGAKNHCIIMPDANLDHAAEALVGAAYGSAGERCMAISVGVVIGDEQADALVQKIKPRIESLNIGPGEMHGVEMGPLITAQHWERVKSYIDLGVSEGAKLIVDGRTYKPQGHESGFFMGGSLFDHVTPEMRIYKEEIFGPVLAIVRVPHLESAIHLINAHEYGNGVAIFTNDGYAARTFASRIQAGMVGINVPIPVPVPYQTFGGWKRSIFGDINMQGTDGVQFYTKVKTVTARWPRETTKAEFTLPQTK